MGEGIFHSCLALFLSPPLLLSLDPPPSLAHSITHIEQITERDKFMSPKEAQDFGIIDHVLTHSPKQIDSEASTDK